jgi:hypothetical protein
MGKGTSWAVAVAMAMAMMAATAAWSDVPPARPAGAKPNPRAVSAKPEDAAQAAADAWVALVDAGKYAEAWDHSAKLFREQGQRAQFAEQGAAAQNELGKVVTRKLKSREFRTSVNGSPTGKYVVIQYNTSFANKKDTLETVTPTAEADGVWRVSGYSIQ